MLVLMLMLGTCSIKYHHSSRRKELQGSFLCPHTHRSPGETPLLLLRVQLPIVLSYPSTWLTKKITFTKGGIERFSPYSGSLS